MDAGEFAFRNQFRLRREPMLYFVALSRTLIYITKVCPSSHFVLCRHKINFVLS